jgi:hypothetical protein
MEGAVGPDVELFDACVTCCSIKVSSSIVYLFQSWDAVPLKGVVIHHGAARCVSVAARDDTERDAQHFAAEAAGDILGMLLPMQRPG